MENFDCEPTEELPFQYPTKDDFKKIIPRNLTKDTMLIYYLAKEMKSGGNDRRIAECMVNAIDEIKKESNTKKKERREMRKRRNKIIYFLCSALVIIICAHFMWKMFTKLEQKCDH